MPKIEAIALYELLGTRQSVIAPSADMGVRPPEARENLTVVVTDDGRRGVANWADRLPHQPATDLWWLVGRDPRSLFSWDGQYVSALASEHAARLKGSAPLDLALLDLCAQIEGLPLWRLLGPEQRDDIPAYLSALYFEDLLDPDSTVDCVVERALAAIGRGHRALKIKVGRGLRWMQWPECTDRDIEVVRAVREAVGPDVQLMLDGDRGYAGYVADAADFVAEVAPVGLEFVEDLVDEHEVAELRDAVHALGIETPLAGGSDWHGVAACEAKWPTCPFDILELDTCRIGMVEQMAVARFANDNGLRAAPHVFGTRIGMYAGLHLGKAAPAYSWCECDDSRFDGYEATGYTLTNGQWRVPASPGLGVMTFAPELTQPPTRKNASREPSLEAERT